MQDWEQELIEIATNTLSFRGLRRVIRQGLIREIRTIYHEGIEKDLDALERGDPGTGLGTIEGIAKGADKIKELSILMSYFE